MRTTKATNRLALFRKRLTRTHRRKISKSLSGRRRKAYKELTDNYDPSRLTRKNQQAVKRFGKDAFSVSGNVLIAKKNLPGYLRRKTYILSSAESGRPLITRSVLRADNYFNPSTRHQAYRSDTRYLTAREKLALSMGLRP